VAEDETRQGIDLAELYGHQPESATSADALINLEELPLCTTVEVRTESRSYLLEYQGHGQATIKGHPKYCPSPVLVRLQSSSLGAKIPASLVIRRGTCLVYWHPEFGLTRTTRILDAVSGREVNRQQVRNTLLK
jgi:hypothetical protein